MNIAVIFAGGVGKRMQSADKPKQFLEINGKAIIIHTLNVFENSKDIDKIVVVCVKDYIEYLKELINKEGIKKVCAVLEGADTALSSQLVGLKMARKLDENGIVLIHDGVRPLIDENLISECIESVKQYGSAVAVSPAIETIITIKNKKNKISNTLKRSNCFYARAPQCFYVKDIVNAHLNSIKKGKYDYIDSATMMLAEGYDVHVVQSPAENIKVTTISDYYVCQAMIDKREQK